MGNNTAPKSAPSAQNVDFKQRLVAIGTVVGVTAMTSAHTFALDVAAATGGSDADANIESAGTWALGISLLIYAGKKVIGFFGR